VIGFEKILVILLVILLLFGRKIPELKARISKMIQVANKMLQNAKSESKLVKEAFIEGLKGKPK
jgi:Sec-independent protein translocase protein TatA